MAFISSMNQMSVLEKLKGMLYKPIGITADQAIRATLGTPQTILYPIEQAEVPPTHRGQNAVIWDLCIGCGICHEVCPNRCLKMKPQEIDTDSQEWHGSPRAKRMRLARRPAINFGHCLFCGFCEVYCPTGAMTMTDFYELADYSREALIHPARSLKVEKDPVPTLDLPLTNYMRESPIIDLVRCIGCTNCSQECPTQCISMDTGPKAVQRYDSEGVHLGHSWRPMCQSACPIHQDAEGYIQAIARGDMELALEIILRDNCLPHVCARVCTHPCMEDCIRIQMEGPLTIRGLKRVAVDAAGDFDLPGPTEEREGRVAVVGSGPAGLTCAYELRKRGYKPTIYEALPVAGGMLAVGIPEFRLPRDILKAEIDRILKLGVDLKLNTSVGRDVTLAQLREEYDAVFLGIGAHVERNLGIEGEDLHGVWGGVDFLRRVLLNEEIELGDKVLVIGGGNSAMDAARTAQRLGAKVTIVYRRTRPEMPAEEGEIDEADEEEIDFKFLAAPMRFLGDDHKLKGLECQAMELGEPDASGRRRPVPIEGETFILECNSTIVTIGQSPDLEEMGDLEGIGRTRWNTFEGDEVTMQTVLPDVFVGGDCFLGADVIITAMGMGKIAAESIHRFIQGEDLHHARMGGAPMPRKIPLNNADEYEPAPVIPVPLLPPEERHRLAEVNLGYGNELGQKEALRCCACGDNPFFDYTICIGCASCVTACPTDCLSMEAI